MTKDAHGIVIWPASVLSTPTRVVAEFGRPLASLVDLMRSCLRAAGGVGIAANQIDRPWRVALVQGATMTTALVMVNPKVVATRGEVLLDEGCLSIPGEMAKVKRAREVDLEYQDLDGAKVVLTASGETAHIIQHEVDHLDGLVYVQRLHPIFQERARLRMKQLKRTWKPG